MGQEISNNSLIDHEDKHPSVVCNRRTKTLVIFIIQLTLCSVGLASYITYDKIFTSQVDTSSTDTSSSDETTAKTSASSTSEEITTETVPQTPD